MIVNTVSVVTLQFDVDVDGDLNEEAVK